jgi:hypothetical protein
MPLGVVRCARELSHMIKAQLTGTLRATASKGRTRILSVAAGPAQELYELLTVQEFDQQIDIVLFDQEVGALTQAHRRLKTFVPYREPGGSTYIGNMAPENPSRWLMEHHLDWQLIYRTREEMLSFGRAGAPDHRRANSDQSVLGDHGQRGVE